MPKQGSADLTAAATALDGALRRFEGLAAAALREPLTSRTNLERVARTLDDVAEADGTLGAQARAMVAAITAMRERQQAQAAAIQARARELQERTTVLQELLTRYESLGKQAGELNALLQRPGTSEPASGRAAELEELGRRITGLSDGAGELAEAASTRDFQDIAHQAESLRQQLLSARNRMSLNGAG